MRYIAEAHLYCSAQPSIFSHISLNDDVNTFLSFKSSIKRLLDVLVVVESCFLSSYKKSETLHDVDIILWISLFLTWLMH